MTTHTVFLTLKARGDRVIDALEQHARTTWARRDAIARAAWASIVTRAESALEALVALPPERIKVALYGLWLVEAYVVATMMLTVLTQFTYATAAGYDKPPDQTGLVFLATILLPSLILGVRWLQREATALEADRGETGAGLEPGQRLLPSLDGAYHALHLNPDAPLHIAEAAYIAAMKRAHPDVPGGSNDEAARLTLAIELIRARAPHPTRLTRATGARRSPRA